MLNFPGVAILQVLLDSFIGRLCNRTVNPAADTFPQVI